MLRIERVKCDEIRPAPWNPRRELQLVIGM